MQRFVSQECLDCILEDVRETHPSEFTDVHPLVLRRMIEELVLLRAHEFMFDQERIT